MNHMSSLSRSPTPADLSITPRDMRFGRDDRQGRWWLNGDPVASAFHTALSVTFPRGEAMFIEAVKAHRDGVPEKLAREIRAFTQQEVIHSREHVVFNKKAAEAGYDLSELEDDVNQVLDLIKTRPQIVNLMATIALEHYTAMMAAVMLREDSMYAGAEPEWAALWKWHAIEEIEHKGVAYDTWLHATKGLEPVQALARQVADDAARHLAFLAQARQGDEGAAQTGRADRLARHGANLVVSARHAGRAAQELLSLAFLFHAGFPPVEPRRPVADREI